MDEDDKANNAGRSFNAARLPSQADHIVGRSEAEHVKTESLLTGAGIRLARVRFSSCSAVALPAKTSYYS